MLVLLLTVLLDAASAWYRHDPRLVRVVAPLIGDTTFDVRDYGAVGDGTTDDTTAIQAALDACASSDSGGFVEFSGGTFLSLPLYVKGDNCGLWVSSTLLQMHWTEEPLGSASTSFLNVKDVSHFAITGGGTIDGNGPLWWPNDDPRPRLVHIKDSANVALYDVAFYDSADHTLEVYADNVEISHVNISVDWTAFDGKAPNTDGVDVHGTPFYIHDSTIDVGDDNVAVHASDILVEDCVFGGEGDGVHGHGASIGSLGDGSAISNVTFRNIVFENTHVGPNIKVSAGATSGYCKDVLYENIILFDLQYWNMRLNMGYDDDAAEASPTNYRQSRQSRRRLGSSNFLLSNITYRNISAPKTTQVPGELLCSDDIPCINLHLQDITFAGVDEDDWVCADAYGDMDDVVPAACVKSGYPPGDFSFSYSYSYSFEEQEEGGETASSLGASPLLVSDLQRAETRRTQTS
ncbi:hypothetical protein CTAYLR_009262 [Chrysophaeum taylorii]|uniref:Rhamnogalacturonase A/B/Epimerase-like pectate lyase domain-containing protein n=1 Tax=Chrysophaeum taylorii TaxID=2483200 RepID=A0AAD7U615_9STRA|nr:hypothetical protein CTAYLR_009262 [Chrysophaeum taylorii]